MNTVRCELQAGIVMARRKGPSSPPCHAHDLTLHAQNGTTAWNLPIPRTKILA